MLSVLSVWSQSVSVRRVWQSLSFYSCHAHSCYMHVFVAGRHGQTQWQTGNGSSGFSHWTEWTMDLSERCRPTVWSSVTNAASSDICTRDRPPMVYADTLVGHTNEGETLRDRRNTHTTAHARTQRPTHIADVHTSTHTRDWNRDKNRVIWCFIPSQPLLLD